MYDNRMIASCMSTRIESQGMSNGMQPVVRVILELLGGGRSCKELGHEKCWPVRLTGRHLIPALLHLRSQAPSAFSMSFIPRSNSHAWLLLIFFGFCRSYHELS